MLRGYFRITKVSFEEDGHTVVMEPVHCATNAVWALHSTIRDPGCPTGPKGSITLKIGNPEITEQLRVGQVYPIGIDTAIRLV